MCSVGIQECTGNIDDLFSSPGEYQTRVLGYDCNFGCLQVLFCGIFQNCSRSFGSMTTAIRSWDSEMAISVPSRPAYFFGTLSRLILRPGASSPMATETPPAPKSLHFLIRRLTSSRRNSLCSLRSVGAFPFCTSHRRSRWILSYVLWRNRLHRRSRLFQYGRRAG